MIYLVKRDLIRTLSKPGTLSKWDEEKVKEHLAILSRLLRVGVYSILRISDGIKPPEVVSKAIEEIEALKVQFLGN